MNEFSVFNRDQAGASTHALIIGVGHYPHLPGGGKKVFENHEGMRQLTSPPYSARKIAEWLITRFANPEKPLATVSLLISEQQAQPFLAQPAMMAPVNPRPATMANVRKAVKAWKEKGDENENNLLLFFFCGHGIAQGPDVALLLQDFGSDQDDPLNAALDFSGLHRGMDRCRASQQCYFIDACRAASSTLIETYRRSGEPVIAGSAVKTRRDLPPREAPIFYSTLEGEAAYGRAGQETVFTEILLKSLTACGSDNNNEDESWRVSTTTLKQAIDTLLQERSGTRQYAPTSSLTTFDLHYLAAPPQIPVIVKCRPEDRNAEADFAYARNGVVLASRPKAPESWITDITVGQYSFSAQFADHTLSKEQYIRPPLRKVIMEERP